MKTIEVHNPNNLPTIDYKKLTDLQGDLKTLPKENLEKLKNSILKYGFRFPMFVWLNDNTCYIIDAHQRKKVLASLEEDGYTIPEVPYLAIEAKDRRQAAELLLQANSRYGEYNPDTSFFEDFDIDLAFIEEIEIPELNIEKEEGTKEFTLEDFIFEEAEVPCWFVIRADITNYQEVKEHIEKLKEIQNIIIEDSNDGTY